MKFGDLIISRHSAWKNNLLVRTMKLTILILTTFLIQVSAAGLAQNVSFVKKNASLKELFSEIRKQTGYNVFWQEGKVNDAVKFDASFNTVPLKDVLDRALKSESLEYTIVNNTIVVKKKDESFIDRIAAYMREINVSGTVTDAETGKRIPNVTVRLAGTTRSVVANDNGYFEFKGLPDNASLIFSSIGYAERSATANATMEIKLSPLSQTLEDVVVSTGYQTLKKGATTGSYTVVTSKDIEATPSVNLLERLEGKVPGVQFDIRNNKIEIRGRSSFPGNQIGAQQPLVVIDGFPSNNQDLTTVASGLLNNSLSYKNQPETSGNAVISTFNPMDIESITFLKDAAATAIWGARAANGVIVITTKRGKKGPSKIDFSATLSTASKGNFSNLTSMNSAQYIELEQELVDNNFISDPVLALIQSPLNGWRSAPVTEAQEWMFKAKRNPAYTAQRDSALSVLSNRSNIGQMKDYMLQRAMTQQYNLSFSGGAGNSTYYLSGNYTKDRPVFKNNLGEKYSVQSNITNNFLNDRLVLTTGLNYNYAKSQVNSAALRALGNDRYGLTPYEQLVDANGNRIYKGVTFTKSISDSLTRVNKLLPWTYNAIDELQYGNTVTTNNAIRFNTSLNGKITDWLNLSISGQLQKVWNEQTLLQNQDSYYTRDLINIGTMPANQATIGSIYGVPKGGVYNTSKTFRDDYGLRAQLDFNKDFGDDHHVDVIAGTEIRQEQGHIEQQILYGYNEDLSTFVNVNAQDNGTQAGLYSTIYGYRTKLRFPNNNIPRSRTRYLSQYSTASYSYLGRYFVTGSVRFDDVNLLGASREARATPLWSAGLRWDVLSEPFMQKFGFMSQFSLRGSYGSAGNPPSAAANVTTVRLGQIDPYTLLPYTIVSYPANPNLNWEITKMFNAAVDLGFFHNRLAMTLETYTKRTNNIFFNLLINSAYGYDSMGINAGTLSGHGSEVNITGLIVDGRDWKWSSNVNFGYNTNKVTDGRFPATFVTVGISALTTGYPIDNLFVYRWAGLDNQGQSQIYAADGSIIPSSSPDVKVEDRVYAGRTTAPYSGGFSNQVSYKNLTLSARATFYLGHKFLYQSINSSQYPTSGSFGGNIATSQDLARRWRKAGDEDFTDVPGLVGTNLNTVSRYVNSDLNVRNAGQLRLQQISLNYALPKTMFKRTPFIKAVNLGATVSNVGLLWVANKEGIDPNYQMTNTYTNLPPTRNYVINLSLSL